MDSTLVQLLNSEGTQELTHAATAYIWFEIIVGIVGLILAIVFIAKFFKDW